MPPSTALRLREIEIFTSKPLFARAEEGRVLWPGASGGFLLLCDRMGRPGRDSCRARVVGVRKRRAAWGSRRGRQVRGAAWGSGRERQVRGAASRGARLWLHSRAIGAGGFAIRGPLRHERVGDPRAPAAQPRQLSAGPFGTTAFVICGPLRHERVCASWILFNQGLCL